MLFIDNKYTKIYFNIIKKAKTSLPIGYTERHHIIPKSLGGNDEKENIVELTAKQHYLCHRLLVKMTSGKNKSKMYYALACMIHNKTPYQDRYLPPSKILIKIKEEWRNSLKGRQSPNLGKSPSIETRNKLREAAKKQKPYIRTEEHKKMMSERLKGRIISDEAKRKIGLKSKNRKKSDATRKLLSEVGKGKPSPHKGKKMYNNGIVQSRFFPGEEPEGYVLGTL